MSSLLSILDRFERTAEILDNYFFGVENPMDTGDQGLEAAENAILNTDTYFTNQYRDETPIRNPKKRERNDETDDEARIRQILNDNKLVEKEIPRKKYKISKES
jgi:hypothetical protein